MSELLAHPELMGKILSELLANSELMGKITISVAALGTLAIYSVLYKENWAYRFAEHVFIGAAAGYGVYMTWVQILQPLWWERITDGQWYWVFALVAGGMFYFIYSRRHVWISRIIFGALLGLVAGSAFKGFAGVNMDRISASFKPIYVDKYSYAIENMTVKHSYVANIPEVANNILFIVILLAVMAYFFFSFEHKSTFRRAPAQLGRWVLMFAFGAMFGATVMARMSLLIGRFYFLLTDFYSVLRAWLHIAG